MKNRIQFPKTEWFAIKNQTANSADVYIYDEISPYLPGNNAQDVVAQLNSLKNVATLNVRLNSPGGSVFDGVAIYNALVRHPGTVVTHVDGIAASIASIIAMAGKEIHMAENAMMMIHNPAAFVFGESKDLRQQADVLDQIKETLVNVYADRRAKKKNFEGQPDQDAANRADIARMMEEETWFNVTEALEQGFATHATANLKMAACHDLTNFGFRKAPVQTASSPTTPRSLLHRRLALHEKEL